MSSHENTSQHEPTITDNSTISSRVRDSDQLPHAEDVSDLISPDISLSSQTTLRYSDVESPSSKLNTSHDSSDSIETLEESRSHDHHATHHFDQTYLQHLTLTHGISGSSTESSDLQDGDRKSFTSSGDSHEVIPDNTTFRPESLSLSKSNQVIEGARNRSVSEPSDQNEAQSKTMKVVQSESARKHTAVPDDRTSHGTGNPEGRLGGQATDIQSKGAHHIPPMDLEQNVTSQSLPQGTITRKGDMIQFVASDLQEKIKQSSPIGQADGSSVGSRRSSIRSFASVSSSTSFATSSGVSRSPSSLFQQSPDDIPPIDASAVVELENHARRVADSLDLMMGNIRNNLHKMSAITIGCQDAYKRSVDITCDSVDGCIKSMYALMAKCEELSAVMGPVDQLAGQIREIKRILDLFESQLMDK